MNKIYRYPGSKPFTIEEQSLFFGRNEDIERLYKFINVEKLIVLYSKSGLGKSSLLNAGIIPRLMRENNYEPMMVRLGSYVPGGEDSPTEIFSRKITSHKYYRTFLENLDTEQNSLWYYFKNIQIGEDSDKEFVIILEQFEELFTYPEKGIEQFKELLATLMNLKVPARLRSVLKMQLAHDDRSLSNDEFEMIYKPIEVKVVIAIRSDKLSLLNKFSDYVPNILTRCYELMPLSRHQAEDAILNPAHFNKHKNFHSPAFDYSDQALEKMIGYLTKNGENNIEPFQLQILCQYVEDIVIKNRDTHISEDDLGNLESVYQNYYDDQIEKLDSQQDKLSARHLIEDGLIFEEEERRIGLYQGQIYKNYKVTPELLQKLVDTHLLRAEPYPSGGFSYELSHDTLVAPILRSKHKRRAEEEKIVEGKRKELEMKRNVRAIVYFLAFALIGVICSFSVWNYFQNEKLKKAEGDLQKKNKQLENTVYEMDSMNQVLHNMQRTTRGMLMARIDSFQLATEQLSQQTTLHQQKAEEFSAANLRLTDSLQTLRQRINSLYSDKRKADQLVRSAAADVKSLNARLEKELYLIRNDKQYQKIYKGVFQEFRKIEKELGRYNH